MEAIDNFNNEKNKLKHACGKNYFPNCEKICPYFKECDSAMHNIAIDKAFKLGKDSYRNEFIKKYLTENSFMLTAIGDLPVNADGMRKLNDAYNKLKQQKGN